MSSGDVYSLISSDGYSPEMHEALMTEIINRSMSVRACNFAKHFSLPVEYIYVIGHYRKLAQYEKGAD